MNMRNNGGCTIYTMAFSNGIYYRRLAFGINITGLTCRSSTDAVRKGRRIAVTSIACSDEVRIKESVLCKSNSPLESYCSSNKPISFTRNCRIYIPLRFLEQNIPISLLLSSTNRNSTRNAILNSVFLFSDI